VYRIVIRTCGTVAAVGTVIYGTISVAAAVEGPDSTLHIPARLHALVLAALILTTIVSASGWLIRSANRTSAATDIRRVVAAELKTALDTAGEELAATVTHEVAGLLEQRLHKVADKTAAAATSRTIAAVREIAAAERELLMADLEAFLETVRLRAHTGGMVAEATSRNGNVASISRATRET
jgi:hypothetical protein